MIKRLMVGLMVGGLLAAMLSGVASAKPPGNRPDGGPMFDVMVECDLMLGGHIKVWTAFPFPAGEGQSEVQHVLKATLDGLETKCVEGTKVVTVERVS